MITDIATQIVVKFLSTAEILGTKMAKRVNRCDVIEALCNNLKHLSLTR